MTLRRKRIIIVSLVVAVIIVLIGVYVVLSVKAWSANRETVAQRFSRVSELSGKISTGKSLAIEDRQQKLQELGRIDSDTMCNVNGLYEWQTKMSSSINAQHEDCLAITGKIQGVQTAARSFVGYYQDEQSLVKVLSSLKLEQKSLSEKDFTKVIDIAKATKKQVADLTLKTEAGKALQSLTIKQVSAVESAWSSVVAANKKEDRSAYEAAQAELQDAYAELSTITDQSNDNYAKAQAKFNTANTALNT